jgi:hypothetical protein
MSQALWETHHRPILIIRCNSDNESMRISCGDIGVVFRSQLNSSGKEPFVFGGFETITAND